MSEGIHVGNETAFNYFAFDESSRFFVSSQFRSKFVLDSFMSFVDRLHFYSKK